MKVGQPRGSPGLLVPLHNAWLPLYAILEGMEEVFQQLIEHSEAGGIVAILLVIWYRLEKRLTRCEIDHKNMREYLMRIHGDR